MMNLKKNRSIYFRLGSQAFYISLTFPRGDKVNLIASQVY